MDPYLAQVIMFAGNFAPRSWAFCQGQLMSIAQNTALFSLLGTTFGGDGQTTFALPDFRGRIGVGTGQGPGLSAYDLGEETGVESNTMTVNQLPGHGHPFQLPANENDGSTKEPLNSFLAKAPANAYAATTDGTPMGAGVTKIAGGSQPFPVIQPVLGMNFIIAVEGIYPSRN